MADATINPNDFFSKLLRNNNRSVRPPKATESLADKADAAIDKTKQFFEKINEFINTQLKNAEEKTKIWNELGKETIKEYRAHIRNSTKKLIHKMKIFGSKEAMMFDDTVKKVLDTTMDSIGSAWKGATQLLSSTWTSIHSIGKFLGSAAKCLLNFFLGPFRLGWQFVDGFMSAMSPKGWAFIKQVGGAITASVAWLWNVGTKVVSYIWEGVSTIFNVGYTILSSAAKILYKGAKGIFMWWYKMAINTIFSLNPVLWIINGAIFVAISLALFTALSTITGLVFDIVGPLLKSTFNIVGTVSEWIWSGITKLFGWVEKVYEGSWLQGFITTTITPMIDGFMKSNPWIMNTIDFFTIAYKWIVNNAEKTFKKVEGWIVTAKEYIGYGGSNSTLVNVINWFADYTNNLGWHVFSPVANALKNQFGFLSGVRGNEDVSRKKLLEQKTYLEKEQLKKLYEATSLQTMAGTPGIQSADIDKSLQGIANVDFLTKNFSQKELADLRSEGIINARLIKSGKKQGLADYASTISRMNNQILILGNLVEQIDKGALKGGDEATIALLKHVVADGYSMVGKEVKTSVHDFKKTDGRLEELMKVAQIYANNPNKGLVNIADPNTFRNIKKDFLTLINDELYNTKEQYAQEFYKITQKYPTWKQILGLSDANANILQNLHDNMDKWVMFENRFAEGTGSSLTESQAATKRAMNIDLPKLATGGIIPESSPIMPLDDVAIQYVRDKIEKIKDIQKPEIKQEKQSKTHITIIEEYIAQQDSYETYTIAHLARGLFGGG